MSKIKVDTVTNVAGSGAPNIPDGITIGGVALASVNTQEHYAQGTEPSSPKDGAVWYDTDDNKAYVYINSEFYELDYTNIPVPFSGERGLFGGGDASSVTNVIDYVTIANTGNATDFGDLTVARYAPAACSDGTYGLFGGGFIPADPTGSATNVIDYVTIATTGNATDFGDLTVAQYGSAACSNGTYGLFGGGFDGSVTNVINYVTIATTGNAADFGDLTVARYGPAGCSDGTYGLFGGGWGGSLSNVIDYVTIATTGNAADFGDLTVARRFLASCSSTTRGLFGGGLGGSFTNVIDYVTIATTGNATDFGDLTVVKYGPASCSDLTYGIFGGGSTGSNSNIIDYVTIATPANATDFGDLTVARNTPAACSGD